MNWALFAMAAWWLIGLCVYTSRVGKPREPIAPEDAVQALIIVGAAVAVMIAAGLRLT